MLRRQFFAEPTRPVHQQERTPGACALIMNLRSVDQHESLFNIGKFFCHSRCRLKV